MAVSQGTLAAPATSDGAKAIEQSYADYFSEAVIDEGIVTVAPSGEDYTVTWNLQKALDLVGAPEGVLRADPFVYTLTLRDGGGWQVKTDHLPSLAFDLTTGAGRLNGGADFNDFHFGAVFDPAQQEFLRSVAAVDALNAKAHVATSTQQADVDIAESGVSAEARAKGARSGVDVAFAQSAKRLAETIVATPPGSQDGPMKSTYEATGIGGGLAISGLRAREIADLWTYVVAHIEDAGAPPALKERIRAALPLWDDIHADAEIDDLTLRTPVLEGRLKALGETFKLTGFTNEGAAEIGVKIDGLAFNSAKLPPWAAQLSPVSLNFDLRASDQGLDKVVALVLDDPSFGDEDDLAPETQDKIGATLLAGNPKLVLAPGRLTTPIVDIAFEGEASVETGAPTGHFTVHADSLDKTIAFLEEVGKTEPAAQSLLLGVVFVKGLATTGPDGRLSWKVDVSSTGAVSVNGAPLPMGK